MPKYVIERDLAGAGRLSRDELQSVAQTSCEVLNALGPVIQWVESYVTEDKIYCLYLAPNEELIRKHAEIGGFPVSSVAEVRAVLDPTSAE